MVLKASLSKKRAEKKREIQEEILLKKLLEKNTALKMQILKQIMLIAENDNILAENIDTVFLEYMGHLMESPQSIPPDGASASIWTFHTTIE